MFRFENPNYLFLLLLLPVLLLLFTYYMYRKKSALKRFGKMAIIRRLMPDVSLKKHYWKCCLMLTAVALFVCIIARPQFGSKLETVKRQGVEVMVCLDVSNSMLAEDISPNRLEKSKQILSRLVDQLKNDKIGLIVFAGDAFIQLPITSDYISAKMFLSSINPSMVSTQGTAIGSAINLAMNSFTPSESSEKTIVLITDGENHEDDALRAAKDALDKKVKVNVLGVGLPEGGPIPIQGSKSFLKDNAGNMIITQLNEKMCQEVASAGNGVYARLDYSNSAMKALEKEINKMNKSDIESKVYSSYDEKYQIFCWILLAVLLIEFFTLDRKNRIFRKIKLFS